MKIEGMCLEYLGHKERRDNRDGNGDEVGGDGVTRNCDSVG
jgi:hypothetical protein